MASLSCLVLLSFIFSNFAHSLAGYYTCKPLAYNVPEKPMNVIDSCWWTKSDWAVNRKALADCVVGYGKATLGGKYGAIYIVTSPYNDPVHPQPGTLRFGVIQSIPLWIVFARDMVIKLKNELIVNSFKTIDGRGAKVEIAYGPCVTIQGVTHVIIHGISIHDCKPGMAGQVRSSPTHVGMQSAFSRLQTFGSIIVILHGLRMVLSTWFMLQLASRSLITISLNTIKSIIKAYDYFR